MIHLKSLTPKTEKTTIKVRIPKGEEDCLLGCSNRGKCIKTICECQELTSGEYCQYNSYFNLQIKEKLTFKIPPKSPFYVKKPSLFKDFTSEFYFNYKIKCDDFDKSKDVGIDSSLNSVKGIELFKRKTYNKKIDEDDIESAPKGNQDELKELISCQNQKRKIRISDEDNNSKYEVLAFYNPNLDPVEFTLMFKTKGTYSFGPNNMDIYNNIELRIHQKELEKYNKLERIKKEKIQEEQRKEREKEFIKKQEEFKEKIKNKNYGKGDNYSTIINVIFIFVFSLLLILAVLLIIVIVCRIFYSYFGRSGRGIRLTRSEFPTLDRDLLDKGIPKRKLADDLGRYRDNT